LCAKDLPGERTQVLNVRRILTINRHPVESDEVSAAESISDTEDLLHWIGDLDDPNDSDNDCAADIESDIEQDKSIEDPECPEQRDVRTAPNVLALNRSTRKSKGQAGKVLMTVNAIETRSNNGVKTK